VSIRQIAEEAGVPLALMGYYFGQKRELFQAIFEHWNSTIRERLDALASVRQHAAEPNSWSKWWTLFWDRCCACGPARKASGTDRLSSNQSYT
jgi:AcrR family transcriptional regulator